MSNDGGRDSSTRTAHSLAGHWEFCVDPDGDPDDADADTERWHRPDASWPADATMVTVPHAWQEEDDVREYAGVAWYRRSFSLDEDEDAPRESATRYFLRFGAVDYEATVWLNGERLGAHRDGYLPFEFDATDAVVAGKNELVVRVFDPEDISEIPHGKQGEPWYTRVSGIWQDVTLESRPSAHVESIRATPDLADDSVAVETAVATADERDPTDFTCVVAVERDGVAVAEASVDVDPDGTASATLRIDDAVYWTPDSPMLYDVRATLERDGEAVDELRDSFGMREIDFEDGRLYLNGYPLYVRGALDQAYYPETLYRPFDDDLFEREIRTAKELGFNLLRKHIKPAHPDFLDAADRLGILVWEEPANPSVCTERSKEEVRTQIRGLIERDFNHPCVVVWSLYNEEWGLGNPQGLAEETSLWEDEEKQAYLADLYEEAKAWDPTRLVCDNSGWAHVATDLNDYHRYFVSPDRADAWSDDLDRILDRPADNYGTVDELGDAPAPADAPLLVSEFGTWGLYDVSALRERYGGDPPWFSHDFLDEPLKRPEGVDTRFEATNLPATFDGFEDLAETWQAREFESVKDVIAEMRSRESVAGYVITEFSDIEWEFNGVLDYLREEKSFHDDFAAANAPVAVRLEPARRAVWADDRVAVDATVFNDTGTPLAGTLRLSALGTDATETVEVDAFGPTAFEGRFELDLRSADAAGVEALELAFETPEGTVRTTELITVVEREGAAAGTADGAAAGDATNSTDDAEATGASASAATVYTDLPSLGDRLPEFGYAVVDVPADADVAVVSSLSDGLEARVEAGLPAVLVPGDDGHMESADAVEYRSLPETESWNLVASLFSHDSDLLADLDATGRLGWAFEDLYPYEVVADLGADDAVEVGYVEGWLANWSSPLVRRDAGEGTLWICTFRVPEGYGAQPVGTCVLNRLIDGCKEEA
ncbi:glycoside hydrolase family 2 protein [Halegenticoccus tardaugens]|uniref:glycoside hydrolase family 2 protein n=1 Tax=Halegenticoccus tardaugens TaxID=2071624 RepID=UPI00100AD60D|nr:sugar-binding domain-containing protein [Halegenticoccus tardaugens]